MERGKVTGLDMKLEKIGVSPYREHETKTVRPIDNGRRNNANRNT